ncbi:MAG: hypothetical protein CVU46_05135 [Chloroflexi bacterium HGW-Chloroflexi-8]|nr:MAG: hypothetical protein CVU46_05135 [Chloroflexi bacterium HGW-Chloroflexi-8]
MNNHWIPPEPRRGLAGEWDKFVGLGQTKNEFWLILIPALLAGLAAPFYALYTGLNWTTIQLFVVGIIAFDLVGGVVTNATSTAKRWYHRPGQGWFQHMEFVAVHAVHIFLVTWLFRNGDWIYFFVYFAYLLIASLIITRVQLFLQRPVALLLFIGVFLLNMYIVTPSAGLEWFVPIFFMKLLVSHLIKETPFRSGETENMNQ